MFVWTHKIPDQWQVVHKDVFNLVVLNKCHISYLFLNIYFFFEREREHSFKGERAEREREREGERES